MEQVQKSIDVDMSSAHPRISLESLYGYIGACLILTLQFQTLPLEIPIQSLPVTTVVAIMVFPLVLFKVSRSPLFITVMVFCGFAVVHSLIAVIIDLSFGYSDLRFLAWLRQVIALIAGGLTFFVFRSTLVYLSVKQIFRLIIIGAIPALLLSFLNFMWGGLNQKWAGAIVEGVRSFMAPTAYTSAFRSTGFAVEPAVLATIIVILLVPVLLVKLGMRKKGLFSYAVLLLTLLAFVWTFSLSGLILLIVTLIAGAILGPMRRRLATIIIIFIVFAVAGLYIFPSNQAFKHVRSLALGQSNVSFNDRFYSVVGPFLRVGDSMTMIGYGLGGVSVHYADVVPNRVLKEILDTKWKEFPSLSSFFGRIFAETGAIGLALFILMLGVAFWELSVLKKQDIFADSLLMYSGIRLGVIAICVSIFVTIGPSHTPFFWFWLAVIDARYVYLHRQNNVRTVFTF